MARYCRRTHVCRRPFSGVSTPSDIAAFLLSTDSLKKEKIGEWLGEKDELALRVLKDFTEQLNFDGQCARVCIADVRECSRFRCAESAIVRVCTGGKLVFSFLHCEGVN